MMRQLGVYMNETFAGVLTELRPGRGYSFEYDDAYIDSSLPPISVTIPKTEKKYSSDYLFSFFSNLLPEGANRRVICRKLRIDESDFFGLLSAMSDKDFIGAVNIRRLENG